MGASIPAPKTVRIKKVKEPSIVSPRVMGVEKKVEPAPFPVSETLITKPTMEPLPSILVVVAPDQEKESPILISGVEVINEEVELLTPVSGSAPFEVDVSV